MSNNAILLSGAAMATAGLLYLFREKSWPPHSRHSVFGHEIHIVKCPKQCEWILDKMMEGNSRCFGFYCEWKQGKPDMLILADPHGICVIIRLQEMRCIPNALYVMLLGGEFTKAGVDVVEKKNLLHVLLHKDDFLQIRGVLDIRYLYNTRPDNLCNIAASKLGINQSNCLIPPMNRLTDTISEYGASEAIVCAKLLARYYESKQKLGPIQTYLDKDYYSPSCTEQGYDIHYVDNTAHCKWIVSKLQEEIREETNQTKCIGFQCTWYEDEMGRRPVELLQIAGPKKICAIIRLGRLDFIPMELRNLLSNQLICKAGISSIGGAKLLCEDYALTVLSKIDLRHLFPRKPNGIVALCQKQLEKIRLTNWKHGTDILNPVFATQFQLKCAGLEAIAAVKLFYQFVDKMTLPLRLADALGDYNFELSVKAAYVNHIPTYLDKEYVESMSPHTQHTLFNNDIHVVSSPEHCRWVISKLREEMICNRNRIGFDFHHDILQLATPNGICALIRLDYINDIPWELREFLKDENIFKWTFDGLRKTRDLFESYFLQINNVAGQYLSDPTRKALIAVAKLHLNFDLGGVVRIQSGIELTDEEIQYCAGNVIAYAKLSNRSNVCKSTNYTNQDVTHMVFGHNIYVVNTTERCRIVAKKLREVTKDFPFLGFDCEWLPWNPRGPITLLQLAGGKGSQRLCVLVRLCYDFEIPQELLDLLNDPKIIKAGVESIRDAQFLDQDYGFTVQGAIDLRFLYPQTHQQQPIGLAALAEKELHVYLNKDKALTLSGFNQPILSYEQIQYAAGDAIVGANLFEKFWQKCNKSMDQIKPFLDIPYVVKKCTQPATLVRNNGGGQNSQFTGHRTFESLVPPTGVFQNSVTQGNVQQPPNPRSKKRSRNKKK